MSSIINWVRYGEECGWIFNSLPNFSSYGDAIKHNDVRKRFLRWKTALFKSLGEPFPGMVLWPGLEPNNIDESQYKPPSLEEQVIIFTPAIQRYHLRYWVKACAKVDEVTNSVLENILKNEPIIVADNEYMVNARPPKLEKNEKICYERYTFIRASDTRKPLLYTIRYEEYH